MSAPRKFAVLGVGKYGSSIARELAEKGAEVIALDSDAEKIEDIKEDVALAITIDCTDKKALLAQRIDEVDAAVVAIGENFEATVLASMNLIDFKIRRVIARASGLNQRRILEKIGVQEILTPESEVAVRVAERLINPNITAFLELPDEYEIAEIKTPKGVANRTLEDINLTNKYNLTLITLKREFEVKNDEGVIKEEHIIGVPKSETVVYETDTLVVFGTLQNVKRFLEVNS